MPAGKNNRFSGTGSHVHLFEKEVYNTIPSNYIFYYKGREIARRVNYSLEQDPVYKTQFKNDWLANAVEPLNEYTQIDLFDAQGNKINLVTNLPHLDIKRASLIYEVEPINNIPASISVVVYTGPTELNTITSNGMNQMDEGYIPVEDKDVVTKDYLDDIIEDFIASHSAISTIDIYQDEKPLPNGINHVDNLEYPVLLVKGQNSIPVKKVQIVVAPFAISNSYVEPTLCILVNGTRKLYETKVEDILEGRTTVWQFISTENIFKLGEPPAKTYWKNSYKVEFNPIVLEDLLNNDNPICTISLMVSDPVSRQSVQTEIKTIGLDMLIGKGHGEQEVTYDPDVVEHHKTVWVSGTAYYPNTEDNYALPLTINLKNNFLNNFRPKVVAELIRILDDESEEVLNEISLPSHLPLSGFVKEIQVTSKYNIHTTALELHTYNVRGDLLDVVRIEIDCHIDESDESNRVTTPDAEVVYPNTEFGEPWDPKAPLNIFDMILKDGEYHHNDPRISAVCFKYKPIDCYSHAILDIDTDGDIQLMSEGNTGWLDGKSLLQPFHAPTAHGDPCKVDNGTKGYYSFGRVVYKSPVFVRIIKATHAKVNSIVIE